MRTRVTVILLLALVASARAQENVTEPTAPTLPPLDPLTAQVALDADPNGTAEAEADVTAEPVASATLEVGVSDAGPTLHVVADPGALLAGALPRVEIALGQEPPRAASTALMPSVISAFTTEPTPPSFFEAPANDPFSPEPQNGAGGVIGLAGGVADDPRPPPLPSGPLLPPPPAPPDGSTVATAALGITAGVGLLARLFSRFAKHTLLLSRARASIHAHVAAAPGIRAADLATATGLGRGAIVHHAQMLENHGLLTSRHDGLHRRFYLPGAREAEPERPPTPKERRILLLVEEKGPMTQAELAAQLGVSRQAVHEQVKRLHVARRLVPEETAGERRWRTDETSPR